MPRPKPNGLSLYQIYLRRAAGRWEWYCDLLTPTHAEVLDRAAAALGEQPGADKHPLRLEHVQDFMTGPHAAPASDAAADS